MFDDPKPLPEGSTISGFTPDAALGWFAAYAGPCGCPESHKRLFMMPVIGWLHVEGELRPAIMSSAGTVMDYLKVPAPYQFIGVIPADEDAYQSAKEIYRQRFGAALFDHANEVDLPPN